MIYGHSGQDRLFGEVGDDRIYGNSADNDVVSGGEGRDIVEGYTPGLTISLSGGTLWINGTSGMDEVQLYNRWDIGRFQIGSDGEVIPQSTETVDQGVLYVTANGTLYTYWTSSVGRIVFDGKAGSDWLEGTISSTSRSGSAATESEFYTTIPIEADGNYGNDHLIGGLPATGCTRIKMTGRIQRPTSWKGRVGNDELYGKRRK
ncbi:MAG: hypothetical protein R3C49_04785 [Planctomycetaceae bacterium]